MFVTAQSSFTAVAGLLTKILVPMREMVRIRISRPGAVVSAGRSSVVWAKTIERYSFNPIGSFGVAKETVTIFFSLFFKTNLCGLIAIQPVADSGALFVLGSIASTAP